MPITAGIDVGTGAIKVALFDVEGERETCLAKRVDRLRQRDPLKTAEQMYNEVLEGAAGADAFADYTYYNCTYGYCPGY
mgnify:CR=1 FL=1